MYPSYFQKFQTLGCADTFGAPEINKPTKNKENGNSWSPNKTENSQCIEDFLVQILEMQ